MSIDNKIELHSKSCSCGGGSWMLFSATSSSPCPSTGSGDASVALTADEWKRIGKPANADDYREAETRADAGDRREFQRFEVAMDIRLSRVSRWNAEKSQVEETCTEVIAKGGALVRSRMAIETGERLMFIVGDEFETRAEVVYVNTSSADGQSFLRVGLRFVDEPFPDKLIPKDAKPI